jgi:lipopolysaccharide biosynthesis glycosyltransferase
MWYEETDIIFGFRASISIKITYFLCYRKIMLASVISRTKRIIQLDVDTLVVCDISDWIVLVGTRPIARLFWTR